MNVLSRPKIVLLGMMTLMPVAGNIWLVLQYLLCHCTVLGVAPHAIADETGNQRDSGKRGAPGDAAALP